MTRRDDLIKLRDAVRARQSIVWDIEARAAIGDHWRAGMDAFCGSLDAAKALHDTVLQNHQWHISSEANGDGYVCSIFDNKRDRYTATTHQPCPARAWLLAILEAIMTQEGGE